MIDTFIFDFGDVIVRYNQDEIIKNFAKKEDIKPLYDACYYDWTALDKGEIPYSEYIKNAKKKLDKSLHKNADLLFENWYKYLPYTEGMKELIKSLKEKGYKIYLLSNAPDHLEKNINYFDIFDIFDGIVISGSIKKYKPNDDIYTHIKEKFNLVPQNSIFIDDREQNVKSAIKNGFHSLVFENDVQKLKSQLKDEFDIDA